MDINFEKAFNTLQGMVDRSMNWQYSDYNKTCYQVLAYKYKQALLSYSEKSRHMESDTEVFEKQLLAFDHNIAESGIYAPWRRNSTVLVEEISGDNLA